jgi:roadblock/LC7 domain-containing protein
MAYPYLIQGSNIVVVIGNKSHTISKTHITYNKVLEAIKASDWDSLPDIIEPKKVVLNYGAGNVSIQGETLFWKGKELNTGLSVRMIQMLQDGFPIEPMVNFMENLYKNPSKRAVTELYGFLEKNNLPITPDGYFLAYKKVRANYLDVHSGTMDNSVGQIVEMERHEVDDNKDITCSTGLHFCGMSYLSCFGGDRTVIVKINPADVVAIPSDYNDAKGRTCRYEVIGELNVAPEDAFTKPVQDTAVGSQPVRYAQVGPKTGDTVFKRGYTEGYTGVEYGNAYRYGTKEATDYTEGYEMGERDARNGDSEQYRYVPAVKAQVANGAWPFPKS